MKDKTRVTDGSESQSRSPCPLLSFTRGSVDVCVSQAGGRRRGLVPLKPDIPIILLKEKSGLASWPSAEQHSQADYMDHVKNKKQPEMEATAEVLWSAVRGAVHPPSGPVLGAAAGTALRERH